MHCHHGKSPLIYCKIFYHTVKFNGRKSHEIWASFSILFKSYTEKVWWSHTVSPGSNKVKWSLLTLKIVFFTTFHVSFKYAKYEWTWLLVSAEARYTAGSAKASGANITAVFSGTVTNGTNHDASAMVPATLNSLLPYLYSVMEKVWRFNHSIMNSCFQYTCMHACLNRLVLMFIKLPQVKWWYTQIEWIRDKGFSAGFLYCLLPVTVSVIVLFTSSTDVTPESRNKNKNIWLLVI